MSADATIEIFDYVLDTYGIDAATQLCFLVCDHASVNVAIARKTSVPMIGCGSHRMNLAMQALMEEHDDLLEKVHRLMAKLNTIKTRHYLREADASFKVLAGKERSLTRAERSAAAKLLQADNSKPTSERVACQEASRKRSFADAALVAEAAPPTQVDLR
ncbi:hypothetical protein PC122_g12253 [Phytophthora cactorum]|nr:hypothetical protein PC122_g12253 [Phytophthora cactorum]